MANENKLEQALRAAAVDSAAWPEFYRVLLESSVFVLLEADEATSGGDPTPRDSKLQIRRFYTRSGSATLPFFSSLDVLESEVPGNLPHYELPARILFDLTRGETLALDANSGYGKKFLPDEVASLLGGPSAASGQLQILMTPPEHAPGALLHSLSTLLATHPNVQAAYLGQVVDPGLDGKPHLLVGLKAEGDVDMVIRDAQAATGQTAPDESAFSERMKPF